MKIIFLSVTVLIFILGCARVSVEAPKEPIKIDITMRLDIYQHVQKDIDAIEGIVTGSKEKSKDDRGLLDIFFTNAYAQEGLNPEVEQAALRRRDRYDNLNSWKSRGVIGENRLGLVQIRKPTEASSEVAVLVEMENSDRMIIYKAIAQKNGVSVIDVQKIYAERLQSDSPPGTPIEVFNEVTGSYKWQVK